MTTIAYKDDVLASDSQICSGDMGIGKVDKVFQNKHGLIGMAGRATHLQRALEWLKSGADLANITLGDKSEAIFINTSGDIYLLDDGGSCKIDAPFIATGSGEEIAMGAMAHGATAIEAVKIAIELDTGSGGKVQHVDLETLKTLSG